MMAVMSRAGEAAASSKHRVCFFGCQLRQDEREYHCTVEKESEEKIILRTMCLGVDATEELHTVEIEARNPKRKLTTVNLASLKSNVVNTVNLGGYELIPPVTFRLMSGSGPVCISGQHLIAPKHLKTEEQENNSSPIKRPSKHVSLWNSVQPTTKKIRIADSDDGHEDETDDDGSDVCEIPILSGEIIDLTITDDDHDENSDDSSESDDDSSSDDDDDSPLEIVQKVAQFLQTAKASCGLPPLA